MEEKEVREVAAALKQAGERVRKALVCKEGRAVAKHREAEMTLLQLSWILSFTMQLCGIWSFITQLCNILKMASLQLCDVLSCVTQISHLFQLQGYYIISWLLLHNVLNLHFLQNIHRF